MRKKHRKQYQAKKRDRSARKVAREAGEAEEVEVLEGPGFRMERQGRFIHYEVDRTPEEHRAHIQRIAESADEQATELQNRAIRLEKRLSEFDTFTVLGALSLQNHLANPETYAEFSHPGKSFVAEYATLLALKSPYSDGTELYASTKDISELQDEIEQVLEAALFLQMARDGRRMLAVADQLGAVTPRPEALDELQTLSRLYELGVRNPAYSHHHYEVLRGLFRPFDDELIGLLGFSVDDAISLSDAITQRMARRFLEKVTKAIDEYRRLEHEVDQVRRDNSHRLSVSKLKGDRDVGVDIPLERLRELAGHPKKAVRDYLTRAALEWTLLNASEICTFTTEVLADEVGVPADHTAAFLSQLVLDFGSIPGDFFEPSATHPLRRRPLIRHEDRYMCPALYLLDWAIQPVFEEALKERGGKTWERFHKHRHDFVLDKSVKQLRRLMPSARFATRLFYDPRGDSSQRAELDALGQYDSMVFLVEAKGQDMTGPARRGAPARLRRDLDDIIAESHRQAVRAKASIDAARKADPDGKASFARGDGGPDVVVATESVRHIVLLSVTLAPIGHLTARVHAESPLKFFEAGEYSWIVNVYDLMAIADILEFPPSFPHYVTRRVSAARLGILRAPDELDIFAYYLAEGLFLDDIAKAMREQPGEPSFELLSYTGPLDAYFAHVTGVRRTKAPKPSPNIPRPLQTLLKRIDDSGLPGRLDVCLSILDLDEPSRDALVRQIAQARKVTLSKWRASNTTMVGESKGGWGITYWCDLRADPVPNALQEYCERKCFEEGAGRWVGVGEVIQKKSRSVVSIFVHAPHITEEHVDARPD